MRLMVGQLHISALVVASAAHEVQTGQGGLVEEDVAVVPPPELIVAANVRSGWDDEGPSPQLLAGENAVDRGVAQHRDRGQQ